MRECSITRGARVVTTFPVVKGELHGLEYNFGVGVGLTSGSDHVVVKFNVALEKYIGAIFGPSSSNAWLW